MATILHRAVDGKEFEKAVDAEDHEMDLFTAWYDAGGRIPVKSLLDSCGTDKQEYYSEEACIVLDVILAWWKDNYEEATDGS